MVETKELRQKTDWLVPTAVVLGGAGIAAGLYFYMKKPPGVDAGDTILAKFTFDYAGEGGTYVLQVSFGNILIGNWFDHVEGLTWTGEVDLPSSGKYEEYLECKLPDALTPQKFDAEALIRAPAMDMYDYLVKTVVKDAISVRKG